ncbi:hypothetical protein NXC14_PA00150 (plasmid) [Rhizobium sp. NXC14]|nr:hypothetical protein NXC14_PA00150 [Rhizobium sp. NXC14]
MAPKTTPVIEASRNGTRISFFTIISNSNERLAAVGGSEGGLAEQLVAKALVQHETMQRRRARFRNAGGRVDVLDGPEPTGRAPFAFVR